MITAMTFLIALLALSAVLSVLTLRSAFHDSRGFRPPPASHRRDGDFSSTTG